ncbi:flagellar basal-body MS-ring/collar protein FliF [Natranaerobius trueperi]|nr:flagellar basal-body MS-ring/collar protein FliF [Natranaerobius trueperi]
MLSNLNNQMKQFWSNLTRRQQLTFSIALVLFFLGSAVFTFSLLNTDYTVIARDLDPKDANEMTEVLDDMNISYKIEGGGTTILVPENDHDNARLELASAGLPKGGVLGYEGLDSTQLGMTESEREMRQKIALEGELIRTIRRYPEVDDARVHLVLPERSLFNAQEESSKAAIYLELNQDLDEQQIHSIENLVAHSVEGLESRNVTLTSGQEVLNQNSGNSDASIGSEVEQNLAIQEKFQTSLQNSVQSMLHDIVGPGNATVRVNATLDFDEVTRLEEEFKPVEDQEGGIIVSNHVEEEFYSGEDMGAGGPPGDESLGDDTPLYQQEDFDGGEYEYESFNETTNYEVNRTETKHRVAPGALENLSVSVAVNQDEELDIDDESIENLVTSAIGLDFPDNGEISVEEIEFHDLDSDGDPDGNGDDETNWLAIAAITACLLTAIYIARLVYKSVQQKREMEMQERLEKERAMQQQAQAQDEAAADVEAEVPETQKQITNFAEKNPEEFAKVLKAWLADD